MVKVSNDTDELVKFIKKFLDNFDEMYPKIKEWTDLVHKKLINEIYTKNSFLEHMTTKI
jgi:ribosomal protein S17E